MADTFGLVTFWWRLKVSGQQRMPPPTCEAMDMTGFIYDARRWSDEQLTRILTDVCFDTLPDLPLRERWVTSASWAAGECRRFRHALDAGWETLQLESMVGTPPSAAARSASNVALRTVRQH